jgi:malonyl CoA-acyl carrier protein transacylase
MTCFMFPGQPMSLADMPAGDPAFISMARLCQDVSGFNPLDGTLNSPELSDSIRLQLFGTTMSLYRFELLRSQHGLPDVVAEHSMGIYPALAACGSIDREAALELTGRIGTCLAFMGAQREYALGSVVGLTADPVESIAANHGIHVANYNTSRHFLLAGEREKISAATVEAGALGAFSVGIFPCDAPLHTPLIEQVAAGLRSIVAEYTFCEPRIALIDHLDQRWLDAARIPDFLVEELCRPVYWEKTCRALQHEGVMRYFEVGVGQALTKFKRWIDSEL